VGCGFKSQVIWFQHALSHYPTLTLHTGLTKFMNSSYSPSTCSLMSSQVDFILCIETEQCWAQLPLVDFWKIHVRRVSSVFLTLSVAIIIHHIWLDIKLLAHIVWHRQFYNVCSSFVFTVTEHCDMWSQSGKVPLQLKYPEIEEWIKCGKINNLTMQKQQLTKPKVSRSKEIKNIIE
jgi:hypothetical protein